MNPNNEPAFPVGTDITQGQVAPSGGMTLLDYLAAHVTPREIEWIAPAGLEGCAKYLGISLEEYQANPSLGYRRVIAKARYDIAAAMLEERKQHV